MADIFSKRKRSEIMSRIRSRETSIEKILLRWVRNSIGHRRKTLTNVSDLPGCPDVVIPKLRVAIFSDGCFYHHCPRHGHFPKSARHYWVPKLRRNVRRDEYNRRKLRRLGYRVWRIWEHDFKNGLRATTELRLKQRLSKLLSERES